MWEIRSDHVRQAELQRQVGKGSVAQNGTGEVGYGQRTEGLQGPISGLYSE